MQRFQEPRPLAERFAQSGNKEVVMKKLAIGLLAAAGIAMSMPANAQGVWVGAGPVGVGVGVGPGWGYRGYYGPGYRSYAMMMVMPIVVIAASCARTSTGIS